MSFLNECQFRSVSGGLGDFVVSSAITGFFTPAQCTDPVVVDGASYYWRAESDDFSQHELFYGAYDVGTTTVARTTVLQSSNAGASVNFSAAPRVRQVAPAQALESLGYSFDEITTGAAPVAADPDTQLTEVTTTAGAGAQTITLAIPSNPEDKVGFLKCFYISVINFSGGESLVIDGTNLSDIAGNPLGDLPITINGDVEAGNQYYFKFGFIPDTAVYTWIYVGLTDGGGLRQFDSLLSPSNTNTSESISVQATDGDTTENGGNATLEAGSGGNTSGDGGDVILRSGDSTDGNAGSVRLNTSDSDNGDGGDLVVNLGAGGGAGRDGVATIDGRTGLGTGDPADLVDNTTVTVLSGATTLGPELVSNGGMVGNLDDWGVYASSPGFASLQTTFPNGGWSYGTNSAVHTPDAGGNVVFVYIAPGDEGTGYSVSDVLTAADIGNGDATFTVTSVGGSGEVLTLAITNPGTGYSTGGGSTVTGGSGTGAIINLSISDINLSTAVPLGVDGTKIYQIEFSVGGTTGTITGFFAGASDFTGNISAGSGAQSFIVPALGVGDDNLFFIPSLDFDGDISAVSVKLSTAGHSAAFLTGDLVPMLYVDMAAVDGADAVPAIFRVEADGDVVIRPGGEERRFGIQQTEIEAGFIGFLSPILLSEDHEYFFPNTTGTLALTANLPQLVRSAAQFDASNNDVLATVTGLSIGVADGLTYRFRAVLFVDADVAGGHKYAINGDCTVNSIIYQVNSIDNGTNLNILNSRQEALAGAAGVASGTTIFTVIEGSVDVNTNGQLWVEFAQQVATPATTSSVLAGSYFEVVQT